MATVLWAQLACARKYLVEIGLLEPQLRILYQQVSRATELADQYSKTLDSIFWKRAKTSTKKRVKRTLDNLAWELANTLEEIQTLSNNWFHEQKRFGIQIPRPMLEFKRDLGQAEEYLKQYHSHQIYEHQLELFNIEDNLESKPLAFASIQQWLNNTPVPRQRQNFVQPPKQLTLADIILPSDESEACALAQSNREVPRLYEKQEPRSPLQFPDS